MELGGSFICMSFSGVAMHPLCRVSIVEAGDEWSMSFHTHTPIGPTDHQGEEARLQVCNTQQHTLSDRLFALLLPLAGNGLCDVVHPT